MPALRQRRQRAGTQLVAGRRDGGRHGIPHGDLREQELWMELPQHRRRARGIH